MSVVAAPSVMPFETTDARGGFPFEPCGSHTRWHCAWSHAQQEQRALRELANQGITAYLPLHCDRRTREVSVLFARYLFVRFDAACDAWGAIRSTRGIAGLICHGIGQPTPLPDGIVEGLIARTSARGVVDDPGDPDLTSPIAAGSTVTLNAGPFAGLSGICQQSRGERVRLLLEILGRSVPVDADRCEVEPI